jgi:hypothetical protein
VNAVVFKAVRKTTKTEKENILKRCSPHGVQVRVQHMLKLLVLEYGEENSSRLFTAGSTSENFPTIPKT